AWTGCLIPRSALRGNFLAWRNLCFNAGGGDFGSLRGIFGHLEPCRPAARGGTPYAYGRHGFVSGLMGGFVSNLDPVPGRSGCTVFAVFCCGYSWRARRDLFAAADEDSRFKSAACGPRPDERGYNCLGIFRYALVFRRLCFRRNAVRTRLDYCNRPGMASTGTALPA